MESKALYYPYINVPESNWIIQQLLYLEELGSIVPYEYIREPEKLSPYMRDLVSSGLVKQIFPAEYMEYGYESPFENSFIELIRNDNDISQIIDKKEEPKRYIKIHIEKFGYGWQEKLKDFNLLKEAEYPWYLVEEKTGQYLMSYVAAVICSDNQLQMTPITNRLEYLSLFTNQNEVRHHLTDEQIILDNIMPVPSKNISVAELVKFKEDNLEPLNRFRDTISSKIKELSFEKDTEARKYKLRTFIDESNERIEEISARLNEKNWGYNLVTISSLASSIIPAIEAVQINNPEDLTQAIPGLVAAIGSEYMARRDNRKSTQNDKFVYAAYIKKRYAV